MIVANPSKTTKEAFQTNRSGHNSHIGMATQVLAALGRVSVTSGAFCPAPEGSRTQVLSIVAFGSGSCLYRFAHVHSFRMPAWEMGRVSENRARTVFPDPEGGRTMRLGAGGKGDGACQTGFVFAEKFIERAREHPLK